MYPRHKFGGSVQGATCALHLDEKHGGFGTTLVHGPWLAGIMGRFAGENLTASTTTRTELYRDKEKEKKRKKDPACGSMIISIRELLVDSVSPPDCAHHERNPSPLHYSCMSSISLQSTPYCPID